VRGELSADAAGVELPPWFLPGRLQRAGLGSALGPGTSRLDARTSGQVRTSADNPKLTFAGEKLSMIAVKNTASISDMGRKPAAVMRQAESKGSLTICRNGRVVGFLVSRDRMEAILETLEVMADQDVMKAVRDHQSGRTRFKDVSCLDDDKG
jgi:hypothetical protein